MTDSARHRRRAPMPEQTVWSEHVSWIDRVPRWVVDGGPDGRLSRRLAARLPDRAGLAASSCPRPAETIEDLFVVGRNLLTGDYMLDGAVGHDPGGAPRLRRSRWCLGSPSACSWARPRFGERAVMPYLVAINTMPKVAFAPLFVSWLGFGIASKVALAAFIAFFPVIVGTAAGLHAADENARMLFRTMGASRWQTLVKLKLPTGMPHFFAGLKNAAVCVVVGAVVGEFLGGGKGFGELIRVAAAQLDTPRVFSLIIYLSLLGLGDVLDRGLAPAPVRLLAQGNRHRGDSRAVRGRAGPGG